MQNIVMNLSNVKLIQRKKIKNQKQLGLVVDLCVIRETLVVNPYRP